MTYLSFIWKAFASYRKVEIAGRRIGNIIKIQQTNEALMKAFEVAADDMTTWMKEKTAFFQEQEFGADETEVKAVRAEFEKFKSQEKQTKRAQMTDVESSVTFIATKLKQEGKPRYEVAEVHSVHYMEKLWQVMVNAEHDYDTALGATQSMLAKQEATMMSITSMINTCQSWMEETEDLLNNQVVEVLSISAATAACAQHGLYEEAWSQNKQKLDKLLRRYQVVTTHRDCLHSSVETTGALMDLALMHSDTLKTKIDSRKAALEAELERQRALDAQRLQWAKKSEQIALWVEDMKETLSLPISCEEVSDVDDYETSLKANMTELAENKELFKSVEALGVTIMAEKVKNPYARFSLEVLQAKLNSVDVAFEERKKALDAERDAQRRNEGLREDYVNAVSAFLAWEKQFKDKITVSATEASGTLQEQLEIVEGFKAELNNDATTKDAVLSANSLLIENNVSTKSIKSHTTSAEVEEMYNLLWRMLTERSDLLNEQLAQANTLAVSTEQLQELEEIFNHFDKDKSGTIGSNEIAGVFQNMDIELDKDVIKAKMNEHGDEMELQPFVEWLSSLQRDTDTYEQLLQSFIIIADNKPLMSEQQMKSALKPEHMDYLRGRLMSVEGSNFNYKLYAAEVFGQEAIEDADVAQAIKDIEAQKEAKRAAERKRIEEEERAKKEAEAKARAEAEARAAQAAAEEEARKEEERRLAEEAQAKRVAAAAAAEKAAAEAKERAEKAAAAAAAEAQRLKEEEEARKLAEAEAAKKAAEAKAAEERKVQEAAEKEKKRKEELQNKKAAGKKGFLTKLGGSKKGLFSVHNWKRRFFQVGADGVLRYYESTDSSGKKEGVGLKGEIDLSKCKGLRAAANHKDKFNCVAFELPERAETFWASADTAEDRDHWVEILTLYM
mmetsp:Transcript_7839/g.9088  ORF Transcript_7839/g.9088 Transcript_7839/m.9088 type:complete len:901 (+) Transcript_7839:3-2705(+)